MSPNTYTHMHRPTHRWTYRYNTIKAGIKPFKMKKSMCAWMCGHVSKGCFVLKEPWRTSNLPSYIPFFLLSEDKDVYFIRNGLSTDVCGV